MGQPAEPTWRKQLAACLLSACLLATGCAPQPGPAAVFTQPPTRTATATRIQAPAQPPATAASATATAAPTRTVPAQAPAAVCSPLEGIELSELTSPDLLKNPFDPPLPGMDGGHHGIDLAYWSRGERQSMLGLPVFAALDSRVAAVLPDRPPYGNAIIIETPINRLPAGWVALPTPAPTVVADSSLFCPGTAGDAPATGERSLYLLYAHLERAPELRVGDAVSCGTQVGAVGTSGKSVNPHLHLEARVGPANMTWESMAHYDNAATVEEMQAYCTWRVSGLFQMFDPLVLLSLQP